MQETYSRGSDNFDDAYKRLVKDFLALCVEDYVAFAYPNNRRTADDWAAYDSAAYFLFDDKCRCVIPHHETLEPMSLEKLLSVATYKPRAMETLRTKVKAMAKQKISNMKPAFTPPPRFTDDEGASWEILCDPKEATAFVDDEENKIYVPDTKSTKLFLIGLLQMANAELDADIPQEHIDQIGDKVHRILECNKFFRVRVVANVEVRDEK